MGSVIDTPENLVHTRGMRILASTLASYRANAWTYEQLPTGTREHGHYAYAVGILQSAPLADRLRQKNATAHQIRSRVGVRLQMRIRPDNAIADYRTALSAGVAIRAALVGGASIETTEGPQHWHWEETTNRSVADATGLLIEQIYTVSHRVTTI